MRFPTGLRSVAIVFAVAVVVVAIGAGSGCGFDFGRSNNLEPGSVNGRVVDEKGKPIAFAAIKREGEPGNATRAGRDGRFTLRGLRRGSVVLSFADDTDGDGVPERAAIRASAIRTILDPQGTAVLSAVLLGDVPLQLTTSITGRVVDDSGAGFSGAVVIVYRAEGDLGGEQIFAGGGDVGDLADLGVESSTSTADDGSFFLPGIAPGDVHVAAFARVSATQSVPVVVAGGAVDAGTLNLGSAPDRSVELVVDPPATDDVTITLRAPGARASDDDPEFVAAGGGGILEMQVPVGIYDVHATSGNKTGVLLYRPAPAGRTTDVVLWGTMQLLAGDPCRTNAEDRDSDGVAGLPRPSGDDDPTWIECATFCASLFGADLKDADTGAPSSCIVGGTAFDCDDDDDGQPDVTEPFACVGLCNGGGDRDGDGLCDDTDPFPLCADNDASICKGEPGPFIPPPPAYSAGEGEGEGEGAGDVGVVGEGEGEGEGEGGGDPCDIDITFATQTDVDLFPQLNCDHLRNVTVSSNGVDVDRIVDLSPFASLTRIAGSLAIDSVDVTSLAGTGGIRSIGTDLSIASCFNMTSVTLPQQLTALHGFTLRDVPSATSLLWPPSLTTIGNGGNGSVVLVGDTALADIGGMNDILVSVGGDLQLVRLTSLPIVDFPVLDDVGGVLVIDGDTSFSRIPSFDVLFSTGGIAIRNMTTLDGGSGFTSLDVLGALELSNNAMTLGPSFPFASSIDSVLIVDNPALAPTSAFFPAATSIAHDVDIKGFAGTDLAFLAGITSVDNLRVQLSPSGTVTNALTSLQGLTSLTNVGGELAIQDCPDLSDPNALQNLTHAFFLTFSNVPQMNAISWFAPLSVPGGLSILDAPVMSGMFMNLQQLGGITIINTNLGDFGDSIVSNVPSGSTFNAIVVEHNPRLFSIGELSVVSGDTGAISVVDNDNLTDLTGLENVATATSVEVADNDGLTSLSPGFAALSSVGALVSVHDNPLLATAPAFPALAAVDNLVLSNEPWPDGGSFPSLTSLGNVNIANMPNMTALPDLSAVTTRLVGYGVVNLPALIQFGCIPPTTTVAISDCGALTGFNCGVAQDWIGIGMTNDAAVQGLTGLTFTQPLSFLRTNLMSIEFIDWPIATTPTEIRMVNDTTVPPLNTWLGSVTSIGSLELDNTSLTSLDGLQLLQTVTTDYVVKNNAGLCSSPNADEVLAQLLAQPSGVVDTSNNCGG